MIYFTSDTHFGHRNIIWRSNRPFKNIEEMDEQLIKNWNRVVKPSDEIYHLGDFAWQVSPTRLKEIMEQLNGHKHLILGNHDKEKMVKHCNLWESVDYYKELKIDDYKVVLFHYPIADWNGAFNGTVHLYGHVHNTFDMREEMDLRHHNKRSFNVCADANNWTPVSWKEIKKILDLPEKGEYYNRNIIITE